MNIIRVQKGQTDSRWAALPQTITERIFDQRISLPVLLRLRDVDTTEPLGLIPWCGDTIQRNAMELNECLFSIMELAEDQLVVLEIVHEAPIAERVILKCVSAEDYQLMCLERSFFEQQILNQGCLVVADQFLPVWLRNQKLPVMLLPMEIQPQTKFARMTDHTLLEVVPPFTPEDSHLIASTDHQNLGESSNVETNAARNMRAHRSDGDRGPWQLRLQRPPVDLNLNEMSDLNLQNATTQSWSFRNTEAPSTSDRQSSHKAKISCFPTSCLFLNTETAAALDLKPGYFISVSDKSRQTNETKRRILSVACSTSVSPGHCVLPDVVASDLEIKYCQSIYLSLVFPDVLDLLKPCILQVQPVSLSPVTSENDDEQTNSRTRSGVEYLKQMITGVLGIDMFASIPQENEENIAQKESSQGSRNFYSRTRDWALSFFTTFSDSPNIMDQNSGKLCYLDWKDCLAQFLTELLFHWMQNQIETSCYRQNIENTNLIPQDGSSSHHRNICFAANQLVKLHLDGENNNLHQEQDCFLRLKFYSDQATPLNMPDGVLLDPERLRSALRAQRCTLMIREVKSENLESAETFPIPLFPLVEPSWMANLSQRCIQYLKPALCHKQKNLKGQVLGVIISGAKKSGKTSLLSGISQKLAHDQNILAHVVYICCRKMWPVLQSDFSEFSKEKSHLFELASVASMREPSLFILDNIDAWCVGEEAESINLISRRATAMIRDIMDQSRATSRSIVYLASCTNLEALDEILYEPGFLDFHLQLPTLSTSVRSEILKYLFHTQKVTVEDNALEDIAQWDSGFDVGDLERICQRAIHCCHQHNDPDQPTATSAISKEHMSQALSDFKPSSEWRVSSKLDQKNEVLSTMDDVGGMVDIKQIFYDCIELPLKFPHLISQSPLRLMTNILLYGTPGSGKTFIVHAMAETLHLRLISVKGPELLNKYVGQSEAAVRNTFKSAVEASPCLLFFDEFEALGRHRGSDTSGIADRIVNQFLAEMDGVESLSGICVIAATSRPDLIDKALLRPGRFDRHVFCGLPAVADRYDILKKTSRKQVLSPDVDLMALAEKTDGYSGADLASIISEAHLHAVRDILKTQEHNEYQQRASLEISNENIAYAWEQSRPSSSSKEKAFLSHIYFNFSQGKVYISRDSPYFKENELAYA